MRQIPGHFRAYVGFTKRNRNTKKMITNDIEKEAMALWELFTGIKPVIDPKRTHDPNWIPRPRGWALNGGKERILQEENAPIKDSNH